MMREFPFPSSTYVRSYVRRELLLKEAMTTDVACPIDPLFSLGTPTGEPVDRPVPSRAVSATRCATRTGTENERRSLRQAPHTRAKAPKRSDGTHRLLRLIRRMPVGGGLPLPTTLYYHCHYLRETLRKSHLAEMHS